MKANIRKIAFLLIVCLVVGMFAGCQPGEETQPTEKPFVEVDYAGEVKLNMASETKKLEVSVRDAAGEPNIQCFVDGDTTHFFNIPTDVSENGVLKARYLAINTPESTGKIEEWGKKASNFTKEKLMSAVSIIIESDTDTWNVDSTGERHLVWVWYKTSESEDYRNLNIEILQNGLALASNSAENRYGDTCMAAINQARTQKLHIYSNQDDPEFYYGEAIPVTLKGLRSNIALYNGLKVVFDGVITYENGQTVYIEEYDAETDMYYGVTVYYGFNLTGKGLEILEPGNRVTIVGSVQYYAAGGTWQVSDVKYVDMRPNDPNNIQLISTGHQASNRLTDPETFLNGKIEMEVMTGLDSETTEMKTFDYAQLMLSTSIKMENLKVVDVYATKEGNSKGAMTLTCQVDDHTISVRTAVLRDAEGNVITKDAYLGKTIDVVGIIDFFDGTYQIKVSSQNDITIQN